MEFANELEQLFYQALRIRRVEEKIAEVYDKIQSPVHLSIGQEHLIWDLGLQAKFHSARDHFLMEHLYDSSTDSWSTLNLQWFHYVKPYISQQFLEANWEYTDCMKAMTAFYNKNGNLQGFSYN